MNANHEWMQTGQGIGVRTYGWEVTPERTTPKVFIEFSAYPFNANSTLTPDEARKLAANLIACAESAEFVTVAESDEDAPICASCNGSGEGQYDGTRCISCKGRGTEIVSEEA